MVDPHLLEKTILTIMVNFGVDEWVSLNLGGLRNRLGEAEPALAATQDKQTVACLTALERDDLLSFRAINDAAWVQFDRRQWNNEHYITQFFYIDSFQLKATHYASKKLAEWRAKGHETKTVKDVKVEDELDDRLPLLRVKSFEPDRERMAKEAVENQSPLGLVIIDVDKFGQFNKEHSLEVGDAVLKAVAVAINDRTRSKGRVYRYGGDEMTILLPHYTKDEAVTLAESIRLRVEGMAVTEKKLKVTITLGIASLPEDATDGRSLFNAANKALQSAKNLGRNLVGAAGDADKPMPTRTPTRKQPSSEKLTEDQRRNIRMAHFRGGSPTCPSDGAILRIREFNDYGSRTPTLLVNCPGCGLQEMLVGD